MTPRARRVVAAAAVLVLVLFTGRWVVTFLADRWWATAISPEARSAVTRWHLLGLLLDGGAVLLASAWFAAQALLVARAIGSIQVEHRIGELRIRQAVPVRLLLLGAVGTGVLLGLITGIGARAWRAPVALAWEGVEYGVTDPLLGVDLGVLVAQYPVWRLAHHFAVLLVVLGIAFTLLLYLGIGAIRRVDGGLGLHLDARRHLGGLLAALAATIAVGYLLAPYRLATSVDVPLSSTAASTRVLAAHAAAGAAIAVAMISAMWALRTRHSLLAASWAVLALAAVTERLVVPAFVAEAGADGDQREQARRFESILYGIVFAGDVAAGDSVPAITAVWHPASLADWSDRRGGEFLGASQVGSGAGATWLVATRFGGEPSSLEVATVGAGAVSAAGLPLIRGGDSSHRPLLRDPRSLPGADAWRRVAGPGVAAGGAVRRVAMAWARQAPGLIGLESGATVDWSLDPRERAERLVPALEWRAVGLVEHEGRLAWLVSGLATIERAPLVTRVPFGNRQVAGVVPAVIATVHADNGEVRLFTDPAADSLGVAWSKVAGDVVAGSDQIPGWLRDALPYPMAWFEAQVAVLERVAWGMGQRPIDLESGSASTVATNWGPAGPTLQVMLEDPARQVPAALLEAGRQAGIAMVTVRRLDEADLPGERERVRAWRRTAGFSQLRDSVRAAGDTLLAGPLRHHVGAAGVVSWQVFRSAGRRGDPAVRWIATATGRDVGGGREPAAAWASLFGVAADAPGRVPFDVVARFEAIRGWIRRADSALVRGDLTAFARAWEALRGLLSDAPHE